MGIYAGKFSQTMNKKFRDEIIELEDANFAKTTDEISMQIGGYDKEEILSKIKEQAICICKEHKKHDPYTKIVLWFPNTKESRLLEVSLAFDCGAYYNDPDEIIISRFPADENNECSFPSALALVSYPEYQYYIKHKNKFKEQSKGWDLDKAEIFLKEIEDDFVFDQNKKANIHLDSVLSYLDSARGSLKDIKDILSKDVFDKYIENISNIHKEIIDNFVGKSF